MPDLETKVIMVKIPTKVLTGDVVFFAPRYPYLPHCTMFKILRNWLKIQKGNRKKTSHENQMLIAFKRGERMKYLEIIVLSTADQSFSYGLVF